MPGPVPIDPVPLLDAAATANCISITDWMGLPLQTNGQKSLATFDCDVTVAGRQWRLTGKIQVDTNTAYSVTLTGLVGSASHFRIETRSSANGQVEAYRELWGNFANNGTSNRKSTWSLSAELNDSASVSQTLGGDGRTWIYTTWFSAWPQSCVWSPSGHITRKAEVNGSAHYNLKITSAGSGRNECRWVYTWT